MLLVCSCSKTEINLRPQDAHTNKISAVDPHLHVAAFIMIFVKGGVRHETSNSYIPMRSARKHARSAEYRLFRKLCPHISRIPRLLSGMAEDPEKVGPVHRNVMYTGIRLYTACMLHCRQLLFTVIFATVVHNGSAACVVIAATGSAGALCMCCCSLGARDLC